MKRFFSALLLFFPLLVMAGPPEKKPWISGHNMVAASYGNFGANFTALEQQLRDEFGAVTGTKRTLQTIGITTALTMLTNRKGTWDAAAAFNYVLPGKIHFSNPDSIRLAYYGWNLMTSIYGKDIIPANAVALVLAPGMDWGCIKLDGSVNGLHEHYRNPFVAPMVRAELRLVFWQLAFGVRASCRYDISKPWWKHDEGQASPLKNSSVHGYGLNVFIGWGNGR